MYERRGMKQASILCFSPPGKETARRLREYLKSAYPDWNVKVFAKGRFAAESEPDARPEGLAAAEIATEHADVIPLTASLADWGKQHFAQDDCLIFVGSAGIAVRTIGPLAVSKKTDPAVLVADDRLQYVIPILSGHLGGANAIACRLAAMTGAEAVLTTATDVHRKLAPDVFAQRNGLKIMDFTAAKLVAAALVRGETITIYTDAAVEGAVLDEVRLAGLEAFADYHGGGAMLISPRKPELTDKPEVLWLVPQTVYLGIGLKAGKPEEAVAQAVEACLAQAGVDPAALAGAASIDIKREEAGLLRFAAERQLPLQFFTAAELNQVEGSFTGSAFVKQITGTDNVCERGALLLASVDAEAGTPQNNGSALLLQPKTAMDGVTAALAMKKGSIRFE